MNFFGVGPLELFFILILGLIVLGPERLPEVGRFIGRKMAELMAWQQQSPEAQMIQQIRKDVEQEIVELRDELVQARAQLNVRDDVEKLRAETRAMFSLKDQEIAAAQAGNSTGSVSTAQLPNKVAAAGKNAGTSPITPDADNVPATGTAESSAPAETAAPTGESAASDAPAGTPKKTVPRGRPADDDPEWARRPHPNKLTTTSSRHTNGAAQTDAAASSAEVQALQAQVEALMAEIHELHTRLHQYQTNGVTADLPLHSVEYK
jgi:sec-independent protein translocase protein TatB